MVASPLLDEPPAQPVAIASAMLIAQILLLERLLVFIAAGSAI